MQSYIVRQDYVGMTLVFSFQGRVLLFFCFQFLYVQFKSGFGVGIVGVSFREVSRQLLRFYFMGGVFLGCFFYYFWGLRFCWDCRRQFFVSQVGGEGGGEFRVGQRLVRCLYVFGLFILVFVVFRKCLVLLCGVMGCGVGEGQLGRGDSRWRLFRRQFCLGLVFK